MGRWMMACCVALAGSVPAGAFTIGETSAALATHNAAAGSATPRAAVTIGAVRQNTRAAAARTAGSWECGGDFGSKGGGKAWAKGSAKQVISRTAWTTARSGGSHWARGGQSAPRQR